MKNKIYLGRTVCSFLIVLLMMPLGHALMILMEHCMSATALHYSAFAMGGIGLLVVIAGVFVSNDTKATILGLGGGLLFWTGWVEFLFAYYAWRYGVHCDLVGSGVVETATRYVDGVGVSHQFTIDGLPLESFDKTSLKAIRGSRPEYLIMPATLGMWMMIVTLYLFCTRTGCRFFGWAQRVMRLSGRVQLKPMTHLPSMVTFLELNVMMWSCYLLLMFCYDPVFLGSDHWVTFAVGIGCLVGSIFMFGKQLRLRAWGANIRMAIATVIVLWTCVEIVARNGLIKEIWVQPLSHVAEMSLMLGGFIALVTAGLLRGRRGSGA